MDRQTSILSSTGVSFFDPERLEKVLEEPYQYVLRVPGKEIRTLLINAFNVWLKVPEEKLVIVNEITRMLHNASLIIDDIEDNSKLRRGIPAAHCIFGVAQTINSGNYIYFKCLQKVCNREAEILNDVLKVVELEDPRAIKIFADQLLDLHRGQGMDIYWRDHCQCPSEDDYKEMVLCSLRFDRFDLQYPISISETGGLFVLAVKLMQLYSSTTEDFSRVLELLGLYFQIRDDYANLQSQEYAQNKSFAEDLTEGKFSFPLIHGILTDRMDHTIINILRQRTTDVDLKRFCITCLEKSGSFAYTVSVMRELEAASLAEIERLGGNDALVGLVHHLRKIYSDK